jgi:hypothetical protein
MLGDNLSLLVCLGRLRENGRVRDMFHARALEETQGLMQSVVR